MEPHFTVAYELGNLAFVMPVWVWLILIVAIPVLCFRLGYVRSTKNYVKQQERQPAVDRLLSSAQEFREWEADCLSGMKHFSAQGMEWTAEKSKAMAFAFGKCAQHLERQITEPLEKNKQ